MDDHYSILRANRLEEPPLEFCASAINIQHQISVGLHPIFEYVRLLRSRFTFPTCAKPHADRQQEARNR